MPDQSTPIAPRADVSLDLSTLRARFEPQAWIDDHAIPVDADGPTEWVPSFLPSELATRIATGRVDADDLADGIVDRRDELQRDPSAPAWVRAWRGPFTIIVRRVSDQEG